MVADQAHAAFGVEVLAVEADDAGRFLTAMLERVKAERRQSGGVGVVENAEDSTFFMEPVFFKPPVFFKRLERWCLIVCVCHGHRPFPINK